ncbi:Hypothetical protein A7982_08330 [Minicystis rosea]|nr:Hypothetical protein A7982_08330 [Minicystis rosea]
MIPWRALGAGAAALTILIHATPAAACAVCGAGDPTLNVSGTEKPYAGRLRISGDFRAGGASTGAGEARVDLHEQRLDLGLAYAPLASLFLTLSVPLLHREAAHIDGSRSNAWTPGDVDLRAKGFVWRGQRGPFAHGLALVGGLRLPSAPVQKGADGMPLSAALQPGGSSVTPLAGASYDLRRGPWFFYASATFFVPFAVRDGAHACDALRTSVSLQYQPHRAIATRLGLDGRLESSAVTDRMSDPNAGGFIGYVSPEIVVSPISDLVLIVGARFPALQALRGVHREDTIISIGAAYDLR